MISRSLRIDKLAENVEEFGIEHAATVLKAGNRSHEVQKRDGPSQENSSSVETVIQLLTELELGRFWDWESQWRSSMSLLPRPSGQKLPRNVGRIHWSEFIRIRFQLY